MEIQERYDELYNIVDTLDTLIEELDGKYMQNYIDQLRETMWEAQTEMDLIEPELQKSQWKEEQAQENEYWASQF